MNEQLDSARDRVINQVLDADSLPEIEAAKHVLVEWMKAHPDEQGMRDGFEQLYTIQEIIEAEEAEQKQGAGHPAKPFSANYERQRILEQAMNARTLPEIAVATQELREWVRLNPRGIGIREAFEGLTMMRDIAEEQEAKRIHSSEAQALVGASGVFRP